MPDARMTNEELTALGRKTLAAQPFGALLGMELTSAAEGRVEFRLPIQESLTQHYGTVHGGAISALADTALTFAGASVLQADVVTSGFSISFVRPAQGRALIARAEARHHDKTKAVCLCMVFSTEADERLCAVAQGTIVVPKP